MAIDTSDPMGGRVQGLTTMEELLRKTRQSESGTEAGDDANPALPSYEWRETVQDQMHSEDDDEGDVTTETEGPGKPPL